MPNAAKIQLVNDHLKHLTDFPFFIIIGFHHATNADLEKLRRQLDTQKNAITNLVFKVVKTSLFKKALEKYNLNKKTFSSDQVNQINDLVKEQTAVLFMTGDYSNCLSLIYKIAKDNENFTFKIGYIENNIYDQNKLLKIAQLPNRDVLIAQLLSRFKTPQSRFVYLGKYNISRLLYVMKNINVS